MGENGVTLKAVLQHETGNQARMTSRAMARDIRVTIHRREMALVHRHTHDERLITLHSALSRAT
jgi:hypothetical protein